MQTNCRLKKKPVLGTSDSLCLVLGYWQAMVHSHCSPICLLWFHKQREWMTYILLWGRGSHLVGGPAGRRAGTQQRVFNMPMIKGLRLRSYFYVLPRLHLLPCAKRPMYGGIFAGLICWKTRLCGDLCVHTLKLTLAETVGARCQNDPVRQTPHQRLLEASQQIECVCRWTRGN